MKVRKPIVFDDYASVFHLILGIITAINIHIIISISIALIYLLYQVYDPKDTPTEKLGDFIEYLYGFLIGYILICI